MTDSMRLLIEDARNADMIIVDHIDDNQTLHIRATKNVKSVGITIYTDKGVGRHINAKRSNRLYATTPVIESYRVCREILGLTNINPEEHAVF